MLEWKPRLVLILATALIVASQVGGIVRIVTSPLNHGW